ncbi:hypothetical protein Syun_025545 [Stephania yunnanensis]|uniref:Uncharacterized protein n=1 Tax=Stephania yunnanensis TaxID=152371 RepID=A0AAP0ERU8_9MAGN
MQESERSKSGLSNKDLNEKIDGIYVNICFSLSVEHNTVTASLSPFKPQSLLYVYGTFLLGLGRCLRIGTLRLKDLRLESRSIVVPRCLLLEPIKDCTLPTELVRRFTSLRDFDGNKLREMWLWVDLIGIDILSEVSKIRNKEIGFKRVPGSSDHLQNGSNSFLAYLIKLCVEPQVKRYHEGQ